LLHRQKFFPGASELCLGTESPNSLQCRNARQSTAFVVSGHQAQWSGHFGKPFDQYDTAHARALRIWHKLGEDVVFCDKPDIELWPSFALMDPRLTNLLWVSDWLVERSCHASLPSTHQPQALAGVIAPYTTNQGMAGKLREWRD